MSATLALISTPGIGSWLLTGVMRRSLMSMPPKPISTALPASCGAGFAGQEIACGNNDERRIRLSRLKLRPVVDEQRRQRSQALDARQVCVREHLSCNRLPACASSASLSANAGRNPSALGSCTGILRQSPSKSMIACTCPTPLAACAKRGSGSIHKLPVGEVEIFAASTMLGADRIAAVNAASFASSSSSGRRTSTPMALGLCALTARISFASSARGHGQRPCCSRVASSISTRATWL